MKQYQRIAIGLILTVFCAQTSMAQNSYDEIFKVADNVIANTSFKIINTETKKLYDSADGLPVSENYQFESPYNAWQYWNGVLAIGMINLSEVSGDDKYKEYALKCYNLMFDNLDYFGKQYNAGIRKQCMYQFFEMGLLDHCGAMSAGLCDVYDIDSQKRYKEYLDKAANYIETKELRFGDGTLVRRVPKQMTLWADDLYMSVPFLARMSKITGDRKYIEDAVIQVKNFNKYLYNEYNGLYYHCYYSDNQQNGVAHWGRCNGWVVMAEVELLSLLPKDHPKRADLIKILEQHIIGLSRYQDYSGMWHQLINKPDSYLESSSTAMFVYGIAKAVNEGWINSSYATIAYSGWDGLVEKIQDDGQVQDICIGTGIKDNVRFYDDRPTKLNDIHGLGAVLLAGAEMKKLEMLMTKKK